MNCIDKHVKSNEREKDQNSSALLGLITCTSCFSWNLALLVPDWKGDRLKPAVSIGFPVMHWQENGVIAAWDVTSAYKCAFVFWRLFCAASEVNLKTEIYTDRSFCNFICLITNSSVWQFVYILAKNNYCGRRLFSWFVNLLPRVWLFLDVVREFDEAINAAGSWIARAFNNHLLRHGFMHRFPQWLWKLMTWKWLKN